ncbi:hypothetical protein F5Y18DRAFT_4079 [Xylariaceae sp. FL1019]|nr:hypothetical protein F5Y18DRAFT_4079 [Xylariaceae sp. FL1019]
MSSPVKSSAPNAPPSILDRTNNRASSDDDRNGNLTHPLTSPTGLPMPGLSGRANSPTGENNETSSKAPWTTTASSSRPRSWSASSWTSRPRCTSRPACAATSSSGCTRYLLPLPRPTPVPVSGPTTRTKKTTTGKTGVGRKEQMKNQWEKTMENTAMQNGGLIPGLFLLGGETRDNSGEYKFPGGKISISVETRGFVVGLGYGSVCVLRVMVKLRLDFDGDYQQEEQSGNEKGKTTKFHTKVEEGETEAETAVSMTLTLTLTIVAIQPSTFS